MSSEETKAATETKEQAVEESKPSGKKKKENSVKLYPLPKFVFLYPTWIAAVVAALVSTFTGGHDPSPENTLHVTLGFVFLTVFILNSIVLAFDFPRGTWLTLVFVVISAALGFALLFTWKPELAPSISGWFKSLRPVANSTFYWIISAAFALIFVGIWITVHFNYWEVRSNELLHHHGILSNLKRLPARNLKVEKEINDVFEYMLLGSGRLILEPRGERPIILENIAGISKKEARITKILDALQVRPANDENDEED